jgi:hypothetical protein
MDLLFYSFLMPIGVGLTLFPFVIFFDYHKKKEIHRSIIYVLLFYSFWCLFIPLFVSLALKRFYILLLIPIFIFGIALRKPKKSDTET